jgi:hypothetical protein
MRKCYPFLLLTAFLFLSSAIYGQSVGIGTSSPNSSAQLDISSSARGLLIPRMTTTAISAISSPAKGLMVYDTIQNQLLVNMGTAIAPNWQTIVANSGWGLKGNAYSGDSLFIGTTNGNYLMMKLNNQISAYMDTPLVNTAFGYQALQTNINTTARSGGGGGANNTAVGFQALTANHGGVNAAFGSYALWSNTSGGNNTALGCAALNYNTTGSWNVGAGYGALQSNQAGSYNTAVGVGALAASLGNYSTAVGFNALAATTTAFYNVAVGYNAGVTYDNGYNNVFLGANTDVTGAGYFNVIAIGQGVVATGSDEAVIGNSATSSIGGYANWTNFSDGRYKKNMRENVKGLDFIMRLRPITYNLDVTGIRTHLGQKAPVDEGTRRSIAQREAEVFSGFAAQEVEQAAAAVGYDFSGVDKPKNDKAFYGLRYGDFVVPLVKAVQEQQKLIDAMQKRLDEQDRLIQQLLKTKQ